MLSTENPPDDPPYSCNFSRLTSSGNELDESFHHQHHLHNFSIRDYVCSIRLKDIKNNWPFSPRSLEFCLRHGITDPLPPFQPLEAVRNQSSKSITRPIKTSSSNEKQTKSDVEKQISACLPDHQKLVGASSNQKLAEPRKSLDDSSLCQSRAQNDLPSTTTSFSQSEIESIRFNRLSSKKSGLVLKFRSTEDIASNCLAVSELMASKTCPVCKSFSSASNTTLNAHIDQCLSADSAPAYSKPTRHRIKPRRIRLMTDVYATAKECTLEDLARRNGTSWAMISSLPLLDMDKSEVSDETKKQRVSAIHLDKDNHGIGPVYVDAHGKKLRSLSEFNDTSSRVFKEGKAVGIKKKSLIGGKGSKFSSTKKKRHHRQKHHKYLKLGPQSTKLFSHKVNTSQISENQEGYSDEGSYKKERRILKHGNLRHQVLAKCTGLAKNLNREGCQWQAARNAPCSTRKNFCNEVVKCPDTSPSANSSKSSILPPAFARKSSRRISSGTKASFPSNQPSLTEDSVVEKLKRTHLHFSEKGDEELADWESEMDHEFALTDSDTDNNGEVAEAPISAVSSFSSDDYYDDDEKDEEVVNNVDDALDKTDEPETSHSRDFSPTKSLDDNFCRSDSIPSPGFYNDTAFLGEEEVNYADEVGNGRFGQTSHMSMELESEARQEGNSFIEVDPILIPGPPGSFLPSPRDIDSNNFPGNSSLTTSQFRSSYDQLDSNDRNSSESPLSAASTVSNSKGARSDCLKYSEELTLVQEKITSSFSTANIKGTLNVAGGAEKTSNTEKFSVQRASFDKIPFGFSNNDQPCRCQRKERSFEGLAVNYPESQLLRRRTTASATLTGTRRETSFDSTIKLSVSDTIPYNVLPSSFSDTVPERKSRNPDPDPERKSRNRVECDSIIPPASNSVLRLMGKDLMVFNKGEEASTLVPYVQEDSSLPTPSHQFPYSSQISPLLHITHQGASAFGKSPRNGNSVGNNTEIMNSQTQEQVPTSTYQNHFGRVPYFSRR